MLVVVHHRNVERFLQSLLNIEAFRSLDVFQIDAAECWGDFLYGLAELLGIFFGHLDIEDIDAAVNLK